MADLLDELHAQAGLELLEAGDPGRVHDGRVPDAAELPYHLVYTTVRWPAGEAGVANALDGQAVSVVAEWTVHSVAETAADARAMQMRARASLLNRRPTIANRTCGLIRQDEVLAPVRDETTGRLVMDAVSVYSMISAP